MYISYMSTSPYELNKLLITLVINNLTINRDEMK